MILVPCPHCGPRNASEFRYMGEEQPRPVPGSVTQAEWRAYLYVKKNPAGWTTETWFHALGCRAFFVAERHTVTNEFRAAARPGEPEDT
jgi:heterotetrameric sarcosine oxidase delta subunit